MRITYKYLKERVARLIELGCNIQIGHAYGNPRVSNKEGNKWRSNRMSPGEIEIWLDGYEARMEEENGNVRSM